MAVLLLLLLPFLLSSTTATLIDDACRLTTVHYDLCVQSLSSDPNGKTAKDIPSLLSAAIGVASKTAVETSTYVDGLLDKTKDAKDSPALQQCLADCGEQYIDVADQLDDAAAAAEDKKYADAVKLVGAAIAEVKTCQAGCKGVPEHKNVLTKRNGEVEKLASIALAIARSL